MRTREDYLLHMEKNGVCYAAGIFIKGNLDLQYVLRLLQYIFNQRQGRVFTGMLEDLPSSNLHI